MGYKEVTPDTPMSESGLPIAPDFLAELGFKGVPIPESSGSDETGTSPPAETGEPDGGYTAF